MQIMTDADLRPGTATDLVVVDLGQFHTIKLRDHLDSQNQTPPHLLETSTLQNTPREGSALLLPRFCGATVFFASDSILESLPPLYSFCTTPLKQKVPAPPDSLPGYLMC
jgi:hypothetical protein